MKEAQSIPHVGESLAAKIWEIISSGHLRRLDQVNSEKEMIIDMFKYVHGVGQVTAQQFYAQVSYMYMCTCMYRQYYVYNICSYVGPKHF